MLNDSLLHRLHLSRLAAPAQVSVWLILFVFGYGRYWRLAHGFLIGKHGRDARATSFFKGINSFLWASPNVF
jgi:hypothetical protein